MNVFAADVCMQLRIRPVEAKLLALALDPAAQGNEITTSAEKLIKCLRERGVSSAKVFRGSELPSPAVDKTLARAKAKRMPFGKYRRKQLRNVPLDYLRWAKDNCHNLSADLRDAIAVILKGD